MDTSVDAAMLHRVWNEHDYRLDVCRVTQGSHIEHFYNIWMFHCDLHFIRQSLPPTERSNQLEYTLNRILRYFLQNMVGDGFVEFHNVSLSHPQLNISELPTRKLSDRNPYTIPASSTSPKDPLSVRGETPPPSDEEEENSEEFYVLFRLYEGFAKKNEKYFERKGTPVEPEEITVDSMKVVTDKERDQPEDNEEIIERQLSSQSQVDAVEIASNEHFQTEKVGANVGIIEDNLLKTPEKNLSNEEKKTLRRSEVRTLEDCLIWPETPKKKHS
ncbi:hypothetical protein ANN_17561 [Periplaneta americana]|uniref:Uncharacterized protein n=1 Tax=Periplaneta americana TaxID=6978 RepID=A0ABQ8SUR9_PERAM|nr:hypothetical protein ANN_17561 [Periplaneta americana]